MDKENNEYFGDEDEVKQGYNGYFFDLEEDEDDDWLEDIRSNFCNMDSNIYFSNFTFW